MKITSTRELAHWLLSKPVGWARVIAVRAALRAVPLATAINRKRDAEFELRMFRLALLSWAASNVPSLNLADALYPGIDDVTHRKPLPEFFDTFVYAARSVSDDDSPDGWASAAPTAFISTFFPLFVSNNQSSYWWLIAQDCQWLDERRHLDNPARVLTRRSLWLGKPAAWWIRDWGASVKTLTDMDRDYAVWTHWFERRIRGERAAFDIPGDKYRKEDKAILRRLAEATDTDFWGKGHKYVNAELTRWLEEARARAAGVEREEPEEPGPEEQKRATPPQDPRVVAYGLNDAGQVDRLPAAEQERLRDTPGQRRRYADLRAAVLALLQEGQRLGPRLQAPLERFAQALPARIGEAEVYPLWSAGITLRRLHRAHRRVEKGTDPDPARLDPVAAEGLGGVLDYYNPLALADEGLRAEDEATISPQERAEAEVEAAAAAPLVEAAAAMPDIATPQALDDLVEDGNDAELPQDDPYHAQAVVQSNRTRRNWFAALIGGLAVNAVWDGIKLTGAMIGGVNYAPLLQFIAAEAANLQHYVAIAFPHYDQLPDLIARIKAAWDGRGTRGKR